MTETELIKLKAEIFDIIHRQEQLQQEIMRLQRIKEEKLRELEKLEPSHPAKLF